MKNQSAHVAWSEIDQTQSLDRIGTSYKRDRRGYNVLKRLIKLTRFRSFPLQLSGYTSIIICVESPPLIRWLGVHQCKTSWKLHLSGKVQYLKYWLKVNSAKQGLFSLTPERAVDMSFAVNLARFFRTPVLYYIDNHIQNRCSKNYRKIHGKIPLLESLFNKAAGLRPVILLKRHFSTGVFLWILKNF